MMVGTTCIGTGQGWRDFGHTTGLLGAELAFLRVGTEALLSGLNTTTCLHLSSLLV